MSSRLRDPVTGLWNEDFFHASARARLAVARRELRPLTTVLLALGSSNGLVAIDDSSARTAAYAFLRTLRESDQACRLESGRFGYRAAFTTLANQVRTEVNALHRTGFGLDGVTGRDFFTPGAGPLTVDAGILTNPTRLAASVSATALGDGSIAALTGAVTAHHSVVVGMAVESQTATRRLDIQHVTSATAAAASQGARGVNLDEEMVEMMGAQHAYEAAARLLTAVDQALDTLINRTGLVGR